MHYVYWLHLKEHTDPKTQGYIGVSIDPKGRLYNHVWLMEHDKHINPHLARALTKYSDQIIQDIVFEGSKEEAYNYEAAVRPQKNIGWNLNKGGFAPPVNTGPMSEKGLKSRVEKLTSNHKRLALLKKKKRNTGKKITTPADEFRSCVEAAIHHNIDANTVRRWAHNKLNGFALC